MKSRDEYLNHLKRFVVEDTNGCWLWQRSCDNHGYGCCSFLGKVQKTHRIMYLLVKSEIPEGLVLDHLCRNRKCCNPEHLEPITAAENAKRGTELITTCPQGHSYDSDNTYLSPRGHRYCLTCKRLTNTERTRRYREKNRERCNAIQRKYLAKKRLEKNV